MSSVRDVLHGRAGQLAASTQPPSPDALATIARSAGRARRKRTVVAGAASALGIVVIAAVGYAVLPREGELPPVAPTQSNTPRASPSPTATPTEPALVPAIIEGFAPVPQLPASEIPWDAVGPGWFAVDYNTMGALPEGSDPGKGPYPEVEGGVSLIAPDGTWYAGVKHVDLGVGPVKAWDGANLWMARAGDASNGETVYLDLELVDIKSGDAQIVPQPGAGEISPFAVDRVLDYAWAGDGLANTVIGLGTEGMGGCTHAGSGFWGWEAADMSFLYSPASGGQLVCFGPYSFAGSADVTLVKVSDVASSEKINHFSHGAEAYAFAGWVDSNEFFFARRGGGAVPKMFRYDLRDNSITEVNLPMYADVDGWNVTGYFDRVSQRHVVARMDGDGWSVDLFGIDGATVAMVEGACDAYEDEYSRVDARTSGGRLLINCGTSGDLEMYSLDDGARIGAWDAGTERKTSIFDAPDA